MPKNLNTPLNDDLQFLVNCCKTNPTDEELNAILSYLNTEPRTLNSLISLSHQHGILPLVYKTIQRLSKNTSPRSLSLSKCYSPNPELLTKLKAHYMSISQRNMLMSAELIRIMKLLEDNGIEALAFKGPTLSQMAYGDITLRQYADLDVLTRKEDIYKIDTLLKEYGYEKLLTLTPTQEKIWIKYAHDMGLIHNTKNVHFEMHWSFLDEDYPMQLKLEDYWKETQTVNLNGHPLSTFSNENLLVYLCIHGSKHLWERIEWIKDIDFLIRKNVIDWKRVIEKSKGTGFEKMIYLGFSLSSLLLGTPLPTSIQNEIDKYKQLDTISSFILESWDKPQSIFPKTKAMLKLFPGSKEQLLYLHKIIIKPSLNEYWYIDLPKGLYWGYYLVRPYLLLKKYLSSSS